MIDILFQACRNRRAAARFLRKFIEESRPRTNTYGDRQAWQLRRGPPRDHAVRRTRHLSIREQSSRSIAPTNEATRQRGNEATRQRERQMRGFTSRGQAQRFLTIHGVVKNLFRVGRHLLRATNARMFPRPSVLNLDGGDMRLVIHGRVHAASAELCASVVNVTKPFRETPAFPDTQYTDARSRPCSLVGVRPLVFLESPNSSAVSRRS